jgi:hypothetical protein
MYQRSTDIPSPEINTEKVLRNGIESPTRGFSERPRARPPPFVEALFYLYVFNIKTILIIPHLSWSELK